MLEKATVFINAAQRFHALSMIDEAVKIQSRCHCDDNIYYVIAGSEATWQSRLFKHLRCLRLLRFARNDRCSDFLQDHHD
jgi:hypothetical protein